MTGASEGGAGSRPAGAPRRGGALDIDRLLLGLPESSEPQAFLLGDGGRQAPGAPDELRNESSLLDLVDHLLAKGLVLNGELTLGLAGIDLVYVQLQALLCPADRVLPPREGA